MIEVLYEVARVDFRDQLSDMSVRTLVLCGTRDRANLPAARQLAQRIPNSRLHLMAGVSHKVNRQKPREFAEVLCEFIGE